MADPSQLRERARRCRMLADGLTSRGDVRALSDLADEYDAEAARAEAAIDRLRALWRTFPAATPDDSQRRH